MPLRDESSTSFHALRTVIPHMGLDPPGSVRQLLHDIEVGSGMSVPAGCAFMCNRPGDAIQTMRERQGSIPADLIDGDVQFRDGGHRAAGGKPVDFDRCHSHHRRRSVRRQEYRVVGESLKHALRIIRQPCRSIGCNGRLDRILIIRSQSA